MTHIVTDKVVPKRTARSYSVLQTCK